MTIKRDELYDTLNRITNGMYSIGLHAIDYFKFDENQQEIINRIKKGILSNGLEIKEGRPLMGTVAFPGFIPGDESDFVNYYSYGDIDEYIIIAIPKVLKNSKGEEIFLGHPVYKKDEFSDESEFLVDRNMGNQGRTISSLADAFIPDYSENIGVLDPMFILGTFTRNGDDIELNINMNHIAFKDDLVPDDYFERKKKDITGHLHNHGIDAIPSASLSESNLNDMIELIDGPRDEPNLCYLPFTTTGIMPAIINTLEELQRTRLKKTDESYDK